MNTKLKKIDIEQTDLQAKFYRKNIALSILKAKKILKMHNRDW